MSRLLPIVLLVVVCGACGSGIAHPAGIREDVALREVQGCAAIQTAIQDAAVAEMRHRLEGGPQPRMMGAGAPSAGGPAAYTKTNTHVAGVDEPDFMKNDGTRIFTLAGKKLHSARSWPPQDLALLSSLAFDDYPQGMFLDEQSRLAVIAAKPGPPATGAPCPMLCPIGRVPCGCFGAGSTKLTLIDAADAAHPAVLGALELPGSMAHARRLGSKVYLVVTDPPRWPEKLRWWPENPGNDYAAAIRALEADNEKLIRAQALDAWLPPARYTDAAGATIAMPYDCRDFHVSNAPVGLGFVTIATIDLDRLQSPPGRSVITGQASALHASKDSLYVAAPHFWWWSEEGQRDWTYVHRFDLTQGAATYVASGGFEGHPIDEDALNEADGKLRVAANLLTWEKNRVSQSNAVTVLDARLRAVASLKDFSPGESVRGARFIDSLAYVTTFRGIDPLFVIDVAGAPRVVGKLEVPGFSTYLHPMDATHLLAIGIDLPADGAGWQQRSLQLSVFDVANPAQPARSAQARVGSAWAASDALWDNHAFNWFPDAQLLAVPFADWQPGSTGWDSFTSEARVFRVTASSIVPLGGLSMRDLFAKGTPAWSWSWSPWVRRTVLATDAAGVAWVYAVSDAGIRAARVDQLGQPSATVIFPQ